MTTYNIANGITDKITENPIASTLIGTALLGGVGTAVALSVGGSKKKRRITHTKRGWKQDRKRRSKQKWEVAYQKRKMKKKTNKRRGKIYYAKKTGQPYILLASGKAKFIKGKRRKR